MSDMDGGNDHGNRDGDAGGDRDGDGYHSNRDGDDGDGYHSNRDGGGRAMATETETEELAEGSNGNRNGDG